ncbi:LexA family protein [Pseudomonas fulva]|uniref:LexA family protein n=1 Tax=Pseudomonas fulva TaxID=47880 RepID=UPI003CFA2B14
MNTALDFEIDDMPQLSLDDLMQVRAPWTYLVKIEGESMQGIGMYSGDLLVVDRSVEAKHGDIVIAAVNGGKRLVNTSSILMRASRGLTVISHWPTRNP